MCECQHKIEQDIKKNYGASFALNMTSQFGYVRKKGACKLIISLPIMTSHDHSLGVVIGGQHLLPAKYCPFCGGLLC